MTLLRIPLEIGCEKIHVIPLLLMCQFPGPCRGQTQMTLRWLRTIAPGDSIVERASTLWVLRLASLFFGNSSGPFRTRGKLFSSLVEAKAQSRKVSRKPAHFSHF